MSGTPFHDLESFIALPRVEGIALAPDGSRAVLTVATLTAERTGYTRSLWAVPTRDTPGAGVAPKPTRLTRSAKGEGGVAFTRGGDVLFVSGRPDAEAGADAGADTAAPQLWLLPAMGGEARAITRLAGGVSGVVAVAADADVIIIAADLLPSADSLERDAELRAARKDGKVAAILHEQYPVRYWDHDLGPDETHLFAIDLAGLRDEIAVPDVAGASSPGYPASLPRPVDLSPAPGRANDHVSGGITPDGRTLVVGITAPEQRSGRGIIVAIDVATGSRTTLFDEPGVRFDGPVVSNDGRSIAFLRQVRETPEHPNDEELWVAGIDGSDARRIAADWDRWANGYVFDRDDASLVVTADHDGRGPVFRIPLDGGAVVRLTDDAFAYTGIDVDRASGAIIALRSSWTAPSHPVRIDQDGSVVALPTPAPLPDVPGSITEVTTTVEDGTRVRAWLVLPDGATAADPAPLLLWIHGGPLNSWNAWSWRWTPLLAAAEGYAVLLPDPALSTGYGLEHIARGWNAWGGAPFTDLMAITDAALARDDLDATRTAAMGGSFGGYMANWVAGHTDRFGAIVTHASLWALDQFAGTTDATDYWQEIFTPDGLVRNDPHRFVDDIVTPMLVIHGDRDYRVPIGEGLRLWSELAEHHAAPDGTMPHRFLYFPDENHWVLAPQHAIVWYRTVFAFLAQHVLGQEWRRPEMLG